MALLIHRIYIYIYIAMLMDGPAAPDKLGDWKEINLRSMDGRIIYIFIITWDTTEVFHACICM